MKNIREIASAVKVDREEAAAHICLLWPSEDGQGRELFAAFGDRDKSVRPWQAKGSLEELRSTLDRRQAAGCGIFIAVNETAGERRRSSDVIRVRAVAADFDGPVKGRFPIPPTFVVATSPGRCQAYWCVAANERLEPHEAASINRVLALRHGGDPAATDVARVLRLAGSWHRKRCPVPTFRSAV